jgi:hypothetical protein
MMWIASASAVRKDWLAGMLQGVETDHRPSSFSSIETPSASSSASSSDRVGSTLDGSGSIEKMAPGP